VDDGSSDLSHGSTHNPFPSWSWWIRYIRSSLVWNLNIICQTRGHRAGHVI
jgi:hypothetical protein